MLDYVKTILQKVSFSSALFEKELRKSFYVLEKGELLQLKRWCFEEFSDVHPYTLDRVFLAD